MSVIEVQNLKKYFGKTRAVDDISFNIEKGEIFGFLGPNGAGKTTTIRCMMDFLRPDSGTIRIFGLDSQEHSSQLKNKIGYLPPEVNLYDGWTGRDHIEFIEKLRGPSTIVNSLIEKLNFDPKIKFRNLSTGNKRKLGIILALMNSPELILMDEPTAGLDPLLQNSVYELLENFQKNGSAIFMSSHNLTEVDKICHRVGIIKEGKLVATENIQNLKNMRMHTVTVHFANQFNKNDFLIDSVVLEQELPDGFVLGVKGDINLLIQKLTNYNLKELEISHASLEEIFLEFYGRNRKKENNMGPVNNEELKEIPRL